jgi:bile acid:Na+ symporter, BASS family
MLVTAATFLPIALGIVMLSLGLTLTTADFHRVMQFPRTVLVALACQALLLPAASFVIAAAFGLPGELAVGLVLLAASPGGTMASLYSHVADGDLALNITLTAVNSLLSIVTLPVTLLLAMTVFMGEGREIEPQLGKLLQVFAIVLVPVILGMTLRALLPALAERLRQPVKWAAALFLLAAAAVAISAAWDTMVRYFPLIGAAVLLFNLLSLSVGYGVPRLLRIGQRQAIAISMEIGLHNGALAIAIALSPLMLDSPRMAVPPSLYGVLSLFSAAAFVALVNRRAIARAGGLSA